MKVKTFSNRKKRTLVPDMTPLIDVVFLLLIFFMVATTFDNLGGMSIKLPETKGVSLAEKSVDNISILIDKDMQIKLLIVKDGKEEERTISKDEIDGELSGILKDTKDKKVSILADEGTFYGDIVEVMALIKGAGAETIDIQTKEKKGLKEN